MRQLNVLADDQIWKLSRIESGACVFHDDEHIAIRFNTDAYAHRLSRV